MVDHRIAGYLSEIRAIQKWVRENLTHADFLHLRKMERWGKVCTLLGYGTAWIAPNPISAALISHGIMTRWFVGHQINHGGYDKVPGIPARYHSSVFAKGWRRYIDWFDWKLPIAWELEHVNMHHIRTGEREDPDLVEKNMANVRRSTLPMWFKHLWVLFTVSTWKWSYYAPKTLMFVQNVRLGQRDFRAFQRLFNPLTPRGRDFWLTCLLPHFTFRFVLIPSLFLVISPWAAMSVLATSILAEIFTNLESFALIGPNHTGSDLLAFGDKAKGKAEYFVRQVITTANYQTGGDVRDFFLGFLNYQIEHHVWPDIPLSKYQEVQPRFKEVCLKYGIPYTQEPIHKRIAKTWAVMVGTESMGRTVSSELHAEYHIHDNVKQA